VEPGSDSAKPSEQQPAYDTSSRVFLDQDQYKMNLAQEGGGAPCIIRGFAITRWQGAYLYVILYRLPGEGVT